MARPDALVPGNCYFSIAFYDAELVLPIVETLVYVGQGDAQDGRVWLFKQPESPAGPDEESTSSERPTMFAFTDSQLHEIVDFDGLIRKLREIAVDHPLKPVPQVTAEPATTEDFDAIAGALSTFLNDPQFVSVTMTIRFTEDGLSVSRRGSGCSMDFFAHPRRDPNEDESILSLFGRIEVQPVVDYFCDGGRTRVLQFPIPSEPDSIAGLCRRVLTEVYDMRRGDLLDYHFLSKSEIVEHRESGAAGG
jgi:hypothetical protein